MRRSMPLLVAAILAAPSLARAQAVVNGVALGATCTLSDNYQGGPVTLTWYDGINPPGARLDGRIEDAQFGYFEGTGPAGVVYRLARTDAGGGYAWTVGFATPDGRARYIGCFRLATREGAVPIAFEGGPPPSGPAMLLYGASFAPVFVPELGIVSYRLPLIHLEVRP